MQNFEQLQELLDEGYASFTTDEVCERLEKNDVPFARINAREAVVEDPQIVAMGALEDFTHPAGGAMRQPRPTGQFFGTPAGLHRGSPGLGEHTQEILLELNRNESQIAELQKGGIINSD